MNIYLVRHGETNWNQEKKVQGPHSSTLTNTGTQQATQIAQYFTEHSITFDAIYASTTTRTRQTAEIITANQQTKTVYTDDLTERFHTEIIGMTKPQIEEKIGQKCPDRLSNELYFEGTAQSILTDHFPTNETLQSVRERVTRLINTLQAHVTDTNILIIGHSIFNQYIEEYLTHHTVGTQLVSNFQKNNEIRILSRTSDNTLTRTNIEL